MRISTPETREAQDLRILEALYKGEVDKKENPALGFRRIRKATRMGTDMLYGRLKDLVEKGYITTVIIGSYEKYYITQIGMDYKDSSKEVKDLQAKPKRTRFLSQESTGPTATVYFKNVSFCDLENVVRPAWEKCAQEIRKGLQNKNAEIGFVGTVQTSRETPP